MVVKRRKTGLILFIVLLAALLAGVGIFLFRQLTDVDGRDTFLRGTTVNGVNVAGMTLDQAEEALRTAVDRYQLKIRFADGTRRLSAEDLELTLTGREPLRKLLREQKRKAAERAEGAELALTAPELLRCSAQAAEGRVDKLPERTSLAGKESVDARLELDRENERFQILPAEIGGTIETSALTEAVVEAAQRLRPELNTVNRGLYDGKRIRVRDSREMRKALKRAEKRLALSLTYRFQAGGTEEDRSVTIDRSRLARWLRVEEDGVTVSVRDEELRAFAKEMKERYSVRGTSPSQFVTSIGTYYEVNHRGSAAKVDEKALYRDIKTCIRRGKSGERTAPYKTGKNGQPGTTDLGGTYVEIDLEHQHLYLYVDGERVAEDDICSGNVADGHDTPEGLYTIKSKDHTRYLRGRGYREWVNCFMPFNGNIGLHDSTWREKDEYGGQVYLQSGSHGCINAPLKLAKKVDKNVKVGTYVVLYGSGTRKSLDGQAISGPLCYGRTLDSGGFQVDAESSGNGELSYQSSDTGVVEVSDSGWVTIKGAGTATVTVTAAETEAYAAGEKRVEVVITDPNEINDAEDADE